MSDLELYKGLKQGDRTAIGNIYDQLLPKVRSWVIANNGTKEDAHDVFQETLETILLKVDKVNNSFTGLVMSMSKNKWIDKLRRQATQIKSEQQLEHSSESADKFYQNFDQKESEYKKYILMEKYFDQLSQTCKQIITLLKSGVSTTEIVTTLSMSSANTVYRRKAACIERWATLVKQDVRYKELYT